MSHQIFGRPWDAPVCVGAKVTPAPVGWSCFECREPIQDGERGRWLGAAFHPEAAPVHTECLLLNAFPAKHAPRQHALRLWHALVETAR